MLNLDKYYLIHHDPTAIIPGPTWHFILFYFFEFQMHWEGFHFPSQRILPSSLSPACRPSPDGIILLLMIDFYF
jgi:hypothetical protein